MDPDFNILEVLTQIQLTQSTSAVCVVIQKSLKIVLLVCIQLSYASLKNQAPHLTLQLHTAPLVVHFHMLHKWWMKSCGSRKGSVWEMGNYEFNWSGVMLLYLFGKCWLRYIIIFPFAILCDLVCMLYLYTPCKHKPVCESQVLALWSALHTSGCVR